MKKAFTLIELIFVIIIIGIMATVGSSAFKTNYLMHDANFILAKIKQTQYEGLGIQHQGISSNVGCINLVKGSLEDNASNSGIKYALHVDIDNSDFSSGELCFDEKGRPYDNGFLNPAMVTKQVLGLTYRGQEANITIQPVTGYAIIEYKL